MKPCDFSQGFVIGTKKESRVYSLLSYYFVVPVRYALSGNPPP